jgi:tRNA 2-thiouridine synthesizing protein A
MVMSNKCPGEINSLEATSEDVDIEVDARGLGCPLPILRTKKALASLCSGQRVRLLATDPNSQTDLVYFAQQAGHVLLTQTVKAGVWIYVLQKR